MKKYLILLIAIFVFSATDSFSAQDQALAIRNLKLANSYRENKDYNKAIKLLDGSKAKFSGKKDWNSKYWLATTYEYYGYIYKDMEHFDLAKVNLDKARSLFKELIKQKDGSPKALEGIEESIKTLDNEVNDIDPFSTANHSANILNFDNLKLKELPQGLPTKMNNLSLEKNRFKEIPGNLSSFKSLKYLNLKNNRINQITESLYELKNLVWLDISGNKIKKINLGINKLSLLKVLDLSDNKLKDIPSEINRLKNLEILNLKGNKIPFDKLKNLIKSMPNTNIMHDEYVIKPEEDNQDLDVSPTDENDN